MFEFDKCTIGGFFRRTLKDIEYSYFRADRKGILKTIEKDEQERLKLMQEQELKKSPRR